MDIPKITIGEEIRLNVIYLRFRGSYIEFRKQSGIMFQRLLDYAKMNNLYCEENTKVMTIYHDNPFITKSKDLRTSVAMSIPNEIVHVEDDEISLMTIAGKYVIGHFKLKLTEYGKAWQYIYHEWLFKSDVKPRDSFPFEMYVTKPPSNYIDKSLTDIYIPIE